ncbi:MAG: ABC transporter permease [Candidatus Saccharimonadales bacterium]
MYLSDVLRRSGRNLRQAKARTILTAMAIAVGAFALTLTLAATNGAKAYVNDLIANNFDPAELIVMKDKSLFSNSQTSKPKKYDPNYALSTGVAGEITPVLQLDNKDIDKIRTTDGISDVRLGSSVGLTYLFGTNGEKYVGTISSFSSRQSPDVVAGKIPSNLNNRAVLLPEAFVQALGFKSANDAIGKPLTLAVSKSLDPKEVLRALQSGGPNAINGAEQSLKNAQADNTVEQVFTVAAVFKKSAASQPGTELLLYGSEQDVNVLQDISTRGTSDFQKYTRVFAKVKDGENKTTLKAAQDKLSKAGYYSQSVEDTQKFLTQAINVLQGIVAAFGLIAVVASIFGVVNTMYISVLQRTREIGLMKALGMRKRDVNRLFRFEAAWIGFLGGVIGSGLAILLGLALNPWIATKLTLEPGQTLLKFQPVQIIGLIIILMVVAVVAGWFPARKASKLDPIEALRTE